MGSFFAAENFANNATPYDIMIAGKGLGLNRAYRRRLSSKARQGTLTAADLPNWFVAKLASGGVS